MNLNKKLLEAINRGLKMGLELDDDPVDSPVFTKTGDIKSTDTSDGYYKLVYSRKLYDMYYKEYNARHEKDGANFTISDLWVNNALKWHEKYGAVIKPVVVHIGTDFNEFVHSIIGRFGEKRPNISMNFIDTSEVQYMGSLFRGTRYLYNQYNGDISEWDTSKVVSMDLMFLLSNFNNSSICGWDVSSLEYAPQMFYKSKFNYNIHNWNTCKLKPSQAKHMFMGSAIEDSYRPKHTPHKEASVF